MAGSSKMLKDYSKINPTIKTVLTINTNKNCYYKPIQKFQKCFDETTQLCE